MTNKTEVILYTKSLGTNIYNLLLFTCNIINLNEDVPENLSISNNDWINLIQKIESILSKTRQDFNVLKIFCVFLLVASYFYHWIFFLLMVDLYFLINLRITSLRTLNKLISIESSYLKNNYSITIKIKKSCAHIYLYFLKDRTQMIEVLPQGIALSDSVDLDNIAELPVANEVSVV